MDYEKKYKEAHDKVAIRFGTNVAKEIFTDLYESEDERVRKDVYNYLYNERHNIRQLTPYTDELDRWLAWLEKQKPINISIEDKRIRKSLINYVKAHGNGGDFTKEKYIDWLEKQGEQPVNDTDEDIVEAVNNISILDMVEPKFKVGDWVIFAENHNSVYQVERIDNNRYYLRHFLGGTLSVHFDNELIRLWTIQDAKDSDVLQLGEVTAIFKEFIGNEHCRCYCSVYEGEFKIPSQDNRYGCYNATPATKEQRDQLEKAMKEAGYTFNFDKKELKKIITPIFNFGDTIIKKHNSDINKFGQFTITDISGGKYWYNDRIICDISEQYEWELVEQKPISFDTSTPVSYDDIPFGEKDYELHEATYFIPEGFHAEIEGDKVIKRGEQKPATIDIDKMVDDYANNKERGNEEFGKPVPCMIRAYRQGLNDAISKVVMQNTDWSEEDEYLLDETIQHLEELIRIDKAKHCACDVQYYQRDIDWLKSLKERIGG